MRPIDVLRHHVITGAIERGEAEPITEVPAAHVVSERDPHGVKADADYAA